MKLLTNQAGLNLINKDHSFYAWDMNYVNSIGETEEQFEVELKEGEYKLRSSMVHTTVARCKMEVLTNECIFKCRAINFI